MSTNTGAMRERRDSRIPSTTAAGYVKKHNASVANLSDGCAEVDGAAILEQGCARRFT